MTRIERGLHGIEGAGIGIEIDIHPGRLPALAGDMHRGDRIRGRTGDGLFVRGPERRERRIIGYRSYIRVPFEQGIDEDTKRLAIR